MSIKKEKSAPVAIPEKLLADCCSEESDELSQLFDQLNKCNTVYEQMNCFGILKQKTRSSLGFALISSRRSIPCYLQICLLLAFAPRDTGHTKKHQCAKYAIL